MAIGIEFTILLLMRYYEERDKGEDPIQAMNTAMTKIGRAILVSAGMVFVGFFVLIFCFQFPFVQIFGHVTMVDMVFIMFATLVVMPALVLTFDLKFGKKKATAPVPSAKK